MKPSITNTSIMTPSIKRRLLWSIFATLFFAIVINSVIGHFIARHEVDEVFDAELLTIARIIRGVIDTSDLESNAIVIGHALDETLSQDITAPDELSDYETKILVQVWKKDGSQMLFHSANAPEFAIAPLEQGFYYHDKDEHTWIVYVTALSNSDNWLLIGEIPQARNELSKDLIGVFIVSGVLALIFCSLLALTVIDASLKPLQVLRRLLRARTLNNLTPLQMNPMPRELGPVVQGINSLFSRISQGIKKEQQFIADAAHELRTPLAVMKLRTQHLQQKAGSDLQDDLKRLEDSVDRSHKMVEQLLLLAKLDSDNADSHWLDIDLVEHTRRTIAELWPKAEHYQVTMELLTDADEYKRTVNPIYFNIALQNLLGNAIRYSPAHSTVTINIETKHGLKISIEDQGKGVSEDDLQQLCDRFYRTQQVQHKPGSGLGLAIVTRVCGHLNATLELSNLPQGGFSACIQFADIDCA